MLVEERVKVDSYAITRDSRAQHGVYTYCPLSLARHKANESLCGLDWEVMDHEGVFNSIAGTCKPGNNHLSSVLVPE